MNELQVKEQKASSSSRSVSSKEPGVTITTSELNGFRRALENKQAELGDRNKNREALAIETSPDELDRIQHANERDYAMSNLERNSNRLREVQTALERMDAHMFGICVDCEKNSTPRHLAAVPWASLGIVCQYAADVQKTSLREGDPSLVMAA